MVWTADDLVTDARREAFVPDADGDLASTDILRQADEVIALTMTPRIRECKVAHWIKAADTSIVSGTSDYRIPSRAQGGGLFKALYVDVNGNELPLTEVPLQEAWRYKTAADGAWRSGLGYTIEGEFVRLLPTPTASVGTLRLKYFLRRSRLVLVASSVAVTAINAGAVGGAVPASWTTSNIFDILRGKPQFDALALDQTVSGVTPGSSMQFVATLPTELAVDANFPDYVCKSGETCVIPLPEELHNALITLTASKLLRMLGDERNEATWAKGLAELESGLRLLSPRVEGQNRHIINRSSPLRAGGRRWSVS